jgi:protein-S-isoprenylcysteine O-methyltransferase Ste14
MIDRFVFIIAILVPMIVQGIVIALARKRNANRLPPGSHVMKSHGAKTEAKPPGSRWSRYGGLVGHWIADLSLIVIVVLYILYYVIPTINFSTYIATFTINWPVWLNWIGIFGIWFLDAWNSATLSYNVNFTACYKSMKPEYVLATGGPYRFVRHPAYLGESLETIFVLLATGIWINVIGIISWFALRSQGKAEEEVLEKLFGKTYSEYKGRTGMFFPKIRHQK